jgi:PilZ domain
MGLMSVKQIARRPRATTDNRARAVNESELNPMVATLKNPFRIGPSTASTTSEARGADRRIFPRKENHSRVESRRVDHSIDAQRDPQLSLALRDLSLGGLSAITHLPLHAGEKLAVYFPPQGASRGWDAYGRVIRCEPSSMGYRIAVEFDPLPAAA